MSVNKAIIIGSLGKDPELSHTPNGVAVCKFTVATSEKFKNKAGELKESTEWHNIETWNKNAENCAKYLSKGSKVYLEGPIQTDKYQKKDGSEAYFTKVKAITVKFISKANRAGEPSKNVSSEPVASPLLSTNVKPETNSDFTTDDIPF